MFKKMLKKILYLLFVVVNVLSLTACSEALSDLLDKIVLEDYLNQDSDNNSDDATDGEDNNTNDDTTDDGNDDTTEEKYKTVSIAEAIAAANAAGEQVSSEVYCITGTIASVSNPEYGNMKITDGKDTIAVYGLYGADGTQYKNLDDKPFKGDTITIYGKVHTFNGTAEFKDAVIVSFEHAKVELDGEYLEATIAEAREANIGEKFVIEGVVARITYANPMIPNGFYVIDGTGSIYVYGEAAQSVKIGNTVKVAGEKDYYVLADEQNLAEKYGYKGCCQLKNITLVENNATNSEFDKNWITDSTVKDIVDTPVTENITTNIYKVNALIKKVVGTGFTNYYFYDIDGDTSGYAYTANSGKDFTWLDEFDGKICTVYLSPINCKSTAGGCFYRFIPILVINENYTFDLNSAADYAIKYEVYEQFKTEYTANPALEVVTSVSSELLGFTGVTVEYTSSNTSVADFVEENGKTIFHTKATGTTTITMTAKYNGKTSSKTLVVTVNQQTSFETMTVSEAIAAADNTVVTVKGIVMSSLVNQTGFYINDGTGVIAVTCSTETLEEIELGQEVVMQGTRIHRKDAEKTHAGQSVITDAILLANNYGTHTYDDSKFDTTKTLNDLYGFNVNEDYSTQVYVVKAVILYEKTQYYTSCKLQGTNPDTGKTFTMNLYSKSAAQYSWLEPYYNQEVTIEVAVCNWNNKTYYAACIISVVLEDGTKVVNNSNFSY